MFTNHASIGFKTSWSDDFCLSKPCSLREITKSRTEKGTLHMGDGGRILKIFSHTVLNMYKMCHLLTVAVSFFDTFIWMFNSLVISNMQHIHHIDASNRHPLLPYLPQKCDHLSTYLLPLLLLFEQFIAT